MSDIELVIKISKEYYEQMKNTSFWWSGMKNCVLNGIPLPKGHGRLIDADELTKEIKGYISDTSNLHYDDLEEAEAYNSAYYNCLDEIENALATIEADKIESEE